MSSAPRRTATAPIGTSRWIVASDGRRYAALRHRQSKLVVVLSDADPDDTAFSDHRIGLNHLALTVPSAADLDEWIARCDELGVHHEPVIVDAAGGRSLILRDPDGIQLELFVPAPRPDAGAHPARST